MTILHIHPIVEGHGEIAAIRRLLDRIWYELLGATGGLKILPPIRQPRSKLAKREGLSSALRLARRERSERGIDPFCVLLILDADRDLPCELAPELVEMAREEAADLDVAVVLANPEYETWFVAAADSLGSHLDLARAVPRNPESGRSGKRWIQERFLGAKYSPTVDQIKMTQAMDLALCRRRSPSFDKLVRELEKRLP